MKRIIEAPLNVKIAMFILLVTVVSIAVTAPLLLVMLVAIVVVPYCAFLVMMYFKQTER